MNPGHVAPNHELDLPATSRNVGVAGFEPATPRPRTECSNQTELHTVNLVQGVRDYRISLRRDARIRTGDLLHPKQARYQAALRPEKLVCPGLLRWRVKSGDCPDLPGLSPAPGASARWVRWHDWLCAPSSPGQKLGSGRWTRTTDLLLMRQAL